MSGEEGKKAAFIQSPFSFGVARRPTPELTSSEVDKKPIEVQPSLFAFGSATRPTGIHTPKPPTEEDSKKPAAIPSFCSDPMDEDDDDISL
jgi:hypothetical protein